jgi:predicted nucleic acid-binding protein
MVDTGAWYALADTSDVNHQRAKAFYQQVAGDISLVTTDAVMTETWLLLTAKLGRTAALAFWQTLRGAGIRVVCLIENDLEAAWHIANSYADQSFSFTDCTTFSIMERLRVSDVFTFDLHFLVYRYGIRRQKSFACMP